MTRLASTSWASVLLGLTFSGAAFAQMAPDDKPMPADDTTKVPDPELITPNTNSDDIPSATVDTDTTAPPDININVQTPAPVVVTPPAPSYQIKSYETETGRGYHPISGLGIGIAAGGGVGGFTNQALRDTADVGGNWDVRLTLGTRSPLAVEASYIGSAQSIGALGLDQDAVLVGNGVQGALRLNATTKYAVQPFIFAGVGWRRYDLTNADTNTSDVSGSDDVLEIPMGLGIAGKWEGVMLDARGEFRATTQADLVPETSGGVGNTSNAAAMHRWGATATAGIEF